MTRRIRVFDREGIDDGQTLRNVVISGPYAECREWRDSHTENGWLVADDGEKWHIIETEWGFPGLLHDDRIDDEQTAVYRVMATAPARDRSESWDAVVRHRGNSLAVIIPAKTARGMGLDDGSEVTVTVTVRRRREKTAARSRWCGGIAALHGGRR